MKEITKLCIIGGGQRGNSVLQFFSQSSLVEVVFVVDIDKHALAMRAARKLGIKVATEMGSLLQNTHLDFIIETTGNDKVLDEIAQHRQQNAKIIPCELALLFSNLLDERSGEMTDELQSDLHELHEKIRNNTHKSNSALSEIDKISNELEVLAINAGIQASRAGSFGHGFSVVAGAVKSTARVTRRLAGDLDHVIGEIASMAHHIDTVIKKAK